MTVLQDRGQQKSSLLTNPYLWGFAASGFYAMLFVFLGLAFVPPDSGPARIATHFDYSIRTVLGSLVAGLVCSTASLMLWLRKKRRRRRLRRGLCPACA